MVVVGSELDKDVDRIAISISKLNLIQTSQLVAQLKSILNLPDSVPTPGITLNNAQQAATVELPNENATVEKTEFTVTLEKFEASSKAKIIRQVKSMNNNMNLVQAKAFVEGAPKIIKEAIKKDEADKIKKIFEDLGASILVE